MITIDKLLAGWRGAAVMSLMFAACAAGAYFLDGDVSSAVWLFSSSVLMAILAIAVWKTDTRHHHS